MVWKYEVMLMRSGYDYVCAHVFISALITFEPSGRGGILKERYYVSETYMEMIG